MGRLTLNILLSFAQFEREVIGERIRDKFAASRRKGMWMGGNVPLGYRVENRKLLIQEEDAATVRMIFERFLSIGSATILARTLNAEGITSRGGRPVDKGYLYKLLSNRVYIGEAVHKGTSYPGEHQPIISRDLWDKVRSIIAETPRKRAGHCRGQTPALLRGLIFAPNGYAMTPAHTRKKGRLYRYYVTTSVQKLGPETCPVRRLPAGEIEAAVIDQVRAMLRSPEMIVKTWAAAREDDSDISETEVREALIEFDALWDELFPTEQARIVQLLVERIDVGVDGISIRLRTEGIASVIAELRPQHAEGSLMPNHEISRDGTSLTVTHPDGHSQAWWSQGRRLAGRRRAMGAITAAHRQHAAASRRPGIPLEAATGVGSVRDDQRTRRSREARQVIRLAQLAAHAARAGPRRGDPRWQAAATMELQPLMRGLPVEWERQRRDSARG